MINRQHQIDYPVVPNDKLGKTAVSKVVKFYRKELEDILSVKKGDPFSPYHIVTGKPNDTHQEVIQLKVMNELLLDESDKCFCTVTILTIGDADIAHSLSKWEEEESELESVCSP